MPRLRLKIRDLKARLSRYLRRARGGQAIADRLAPNGDPAHRKVAEGISRLVASGAAQWGGGKPRGAEIRLSDVGPRVSDMVLQDRGSVATPASGPVRVRPQGGKRVP